MATTLPGKSVAVDLIRGVSILYIVGYWHLFDYTAAFPASRNPFTQCATVVALSLFVFLSGFLLAGGVGSKKLPSAAQFFKTRFLKIYPPFAVAALAFFVFHWINFATLLRTLSLVSMFWGPPAPTIWFIGMISIFYLLTPILIGLANKSKVLFLAGSFAFFAAFAIYANITHIADVRVLLYFPAFILGIWVARYGLAVNFWGLVCTGLVCLFCVTLLIFYPEIEPQYSPYFIPLALAGAMGVYFITAKMTFSPRVATFAASLAGPSYMMFLVHRPMYALLKKLYFPADGSLQIAYLYLVCLPIVYLAAKFLHRYYESFFARYVRRVRV